MELLVVTLVYTMPGRDADTQARIRLVADTVRNAHALVTARFYRSKGTKPYYVLLSTWEDDEGWRRAQERYSPKHLLLSSATELLVAPPEQWLMRYLWGYSRPAAQPTIAAAHIADIRPDQADVAQRGWIEGSRRQAVQPTLAFAFLARGTREDTSFTQTLSTPGEGDPSIHSGSTFLNLLSWSSEADREEFYADPNYEAINRFVGSIGVVQMLPLEL